MKITVEIECETISDFYSHLSELRRQIKKECKRLKLEPSNDEFPSTVDLYDDNCYGTHTVTISEEFLSEKVEGFRAHNIIGEFKSLLNNQQSVQVSDTTKPNQGTDDGNQNKSVDVEKMAEEAIPNHPYPDMTYPGDAVTKISRRAWIAGYKASKQL